MISKNFLYLIFNDTIEEIIYMNKIDDKGVRAGEFLEQKHVLTENILTPCRTNEFR